MAAGLKGSFASGERAVMSGTSQAAAGEPSSSAAAGEPPAWARRMKREQTIQRGVTAADHAIRSGDQSGSGHQADLSDRE
jgi:type IV secretion system protein TrbL